MRTIEVVYSPLCEVNGAMVGKLRHWLAGTDVQINAIPFHLYTQGLGNGQAMRENCFIDVYYCGEKIDSVPLHRNLIYEALGIEAGRESDDEVQVLGDVMNRDQFKKRLQEGKIQFHPITKENYLEEMSMCLCNYPFGNPPIQYHKECIALKSQVFEEVWESEDVAGVFAVYDDKVIGLLEVMPREILKKYGYMTGTIGEKKVCLSVGCYEVGYGIPRVEMIEELMCQLEKIYPCFHRRQIEGVGIYDWNDGFNPYWVYEKYGFHKVEQLSENVVVMSKAIYSH